MPALALPKSRKVKTEQTSSMATLVGTPSSRTPSSDGADGMPVFLAAQWQGVVVPALYRALNCSSSPCEVGLQGTTTVKLVQAVINKLYPGNTYEVKWNDAVCAKVSYSPFAYCYSLTVNQAAARLMEYRSFIGTAGMDTVAAYIAETPLLNTNSLELKKYARYANKPGGPALFKAPPPPDAIHIQDPKDPIYVVCVFLERFVFYLTSHRSCRNREAFWKAPCSSAYWRRSSRRSTKTVPSALWH
jgi:hypothetical protein